MSSRTLVSQAVQRRQPSPNDQATQHRVGSLSFQRRTLPTDMVEETYVLEAERTLLEFSLTHPVQLRWSDGSTRENLEVRLAQDIGRASTMPKALQQRGEAYLMNFFLRHLSGQAPEDCRDQGGVRSRGTRQGKKPGTPLIKIRKTSAVTMLQHQLTCFHKPAENRVIVTCQPVRPSQSTLHRA